MYHRLLLAIIGYLSHVILLLAIVSYFIQGYFWLFYHKLLLVIKLFYHGMFLVTLS
jgi:hypothetical protein